MTATYRYIYNCTHTHTHTHTHIQTQTHNTQTRNTHNTHTHIIVNGYMPGWLPYTRGFPLGNLLGPIFFIYINDLPDNVQYSEIL